MKPLASHNYNYIFYTRFREMLPTINYFLYNRVYNRKIIINDIPTPSDFKSLDVYSMYKPRVCYYV